MASRLIGYVRVSTTDQEESGLSIRHQTAAISAYCTAFGYELVTVVTEVASGATANGRQILQAALTAISSGQADGLIVFKLDRLSRSIMDVMFMVEKYFLTKELHSVSERIDTSSAAGRLIMGIFAMFAQYERELIVERTKDALQQRMAEGKLTGSVPLGKILGEDGETLMENIEEAAAITMAAMLASQGQGIREIARRLDEAGHRTRSRRPWHPEQVKRLLRAHEAIQAKLAKAKA